MTMTMKRWVLWLCVAALLATEVFLFMAKSQKDTALVQLHEARLVAVQLRAQLDQLKNSSVATLSAENARLRAENQSMAQKFTRLQKENNQLHKGNQQLTQQLQTTSDAAQQQPMQPEEQQAAAAPEPAAEQSAAVAAAADQLNTCINNLRLIEAAKQQWAMDNSKTDDDIPNALELLPYFRDDVFPACPAGGTYTINAVGVLPTCSVPGHVLPQ
jgi:TolA-binding protein